ncbi:hypothetical protein JW964_19320 [candidate division KSB1 bacterium]|nr:hypothetical protein [candidate division KSB1 bacterium]
MGLLNFGAPWCGSCRKQTKEIKELYQNYGGKL